jgi:hypothetical protein
LNIEFAIMARTRGHARNAEEVGMDRYLKLLIIESAIMARTGGSARNVEEVGMGKYLILDYRICDHGKYKIRCKDCKQSRLVLFYYSYMPS